MTKNLRYQRVADAGRLLRREKLQHMIPTLMKW